MAKAKPAQGFLRDGAVVVGDVAQANALHNRTRIGDPQPGNALRLSLIEAAWAVAQGRLVITHETTIVAAGDLLARTGARVTDYFVYADLRDRGLTVRHVPDGLAAWPRGAGLDEAPAYVVVPTDEGHKPTASQLVSWAAKGMILALVDGDAIVTYYTAAPEIPSGELSSGNLPQATGRILDGRILVADPEAAARLRGAFLGTPTGAGLVLSLVEAEALRSQGVLSGADGLVGDARRRDPRFAGVLATYLALRHAGVVAKSGFKFGTDLRGYRGDPDDGHAQWLIQCAAPQELLEWSRLSRGIRLAHGVRKRFLVAVAGPEGVRFVVVSWFKP